MVSMDIGPLRTTQDEIIGVALQQIITVLVESQVILESDI